MATSAQQMRSFQGLSVLRAGFRPFFLAASIWAAVMAPLWVWVYSGKGQIPPGVSLAWHGHEMLFGYLGGVIAGFLLTAIPNWTGRLPVTGTPLLLLFLSWLVGRIVMMTPWWSGLPGLLGDGLFLTVFASVVWREVWIGKNWRNLPVAVMISVLALCNIAFHCGAQELPIRIAIGVIVTLVCLIGGRIIPSFTTNWLKKRDASTLPVPFNKFDLIVVSGTAGSMLVWALAPVEILTGLLLCAAGIGNAIRLCRWCGNKVWDEALVWILHVGYAWIPAGLILMGIASVTNVLNLGFSLPTAGSLHALTAGAMTIMSLAVMTRATLGHTGRGLHAGPGTTALYLLANLAALVRVSAAFVPSLYVFGLTLSGYLWAGAFGLFICLFGPKLIGPRPTAKT
jgi:uncharacterized protein involved in response to NO